MTVNSVIVGGASVVRLAFGVAVLVSAGLYQFVAPDYVNPASWQYDT